MLPAGVPIAAATRPYPPSAAACERIGHWQGAEEHFLEFQARGVPPNTVAYNRLISALGRGGQWERALAAFAAMQGGGATTASRAAAAAEGEAAAAAAAVYNASPPAKPDRISYGSLIAALERGRAVAARPERV